MTPPTQHARVVAEHVSNLMSPVSKQEAQYSKRYGARRDGRNSSVGGVRIVRFWRV